MTYKKLNPNQTLSLSLSLSLSLFHLNTCSLNKSFDDLEYLIKTTNQIFAVIAISEFRIESSMDITTNINVPSYVIEYTPRESHAAGSLLYISNNIAYKPRKEV